MVGGTILFAGVICAAENRLIVEILKEGFEVTLHRIHTESMWATGRLSSAWGHQDMGTLDADLQIIMGGRVQVAAAVNTVIRVI